MQIMPILIADIDRGWTEELPDRIAAVLHVRGHLVECWRTGDGEYGWTCDCGATGTHRYTPQRTAAIGQHWLTTLQRPPIPGATP